MTLPPGTKIHKWTLVELAKDARRRTVWICKCECGRVTLIAQCHLLTDRSKMCHWCSNGIKARTANWVYKQKHQVVGADKVIEATTVEDFIEEWKRKNE